MSADEVVPAARALAAHGLVDAFGHLSARTPVGFAVTPAVALGTLDEGAGLIEVSLDADELPARAPKEAWIHHAIYRRRPDVHAVCRAQPRAVNEACGAGVVLRALHGQGAFHGAAVPIHDDARLVRESSQAAAVAGALGDGDAIVLRGSGAVTVASTPGRAVALMYVLDVSARINLAAAMTGTARPLSDHEYAAWRAVAEEITGRLWAYLDVSAHSRVASPGP
jgi:HCOMODA/2-hydroxy-3-carboxy-muconic semialdehyde decarboxylase